MRRVLVVSGVGLGLTIAGFVLLILAIDRVVPSVLAFVGLVMGLVVGPLVFVGGLVLYALRRPTEAELASQKEGDFRTWHFRPAGLLLLVVLVGAVVAAGNWAERYVPGVASGRRPLTGYVLGLVCLVLLSSRKVRDFAFYTGWRRGGKGEARGRGDLARDEPPSRP